MPANRIKLLGAILAALSGCAPEPYHEFGAFSMTSSAVPDTVHGRITVGKVSPMSGTGYEIIFQVGGDSTVAGVLEGGIFTATTAMPFKTANYLDTPASGLSGSLPFQVRMGFPGFLPAFDIDAGTLEITRSQDSTTGRFRFDCSTCADSAKPALWFKGRFSYRSRK